MVDRFFQALLIVPCLALSWLGMMAVHELGHVAHLWLSGGTVDYVLLHPLAISYTHPGRNPHPLFVASGGAIWGCGVPLGILGLVRRAVPSKAYLARFFAGFCLMADGAYLAADGFLQGGDARELIQHGTPPWLLVLLGVPCAAAGLRLWNGQGPSFGLGADLSQVNRRDAVAVALALLIVVAVELALSRPLF
jgi:hypothetical protein